ncbi:MAG: chemotaxis protein MotA [Candidatus Latescibacterota bacterium]
MPSLLIERMVGFAETARREGILALEAALRKEDDPFLSGGVGLAVDGTEPDLIMDIPETELRFREPVTR